MSENDKTSETAAATPAVCRASSDLRTFCIALLTSIVVVAAYHIGTRFCRMFCTAPGACGKPAVTYMLVPIVPPAGCPAMTGGCPMGKTFRHPGKFGHHHGQIPGKHFRKPGEGGPAMKRKMPPKAAPEAEKAAPAAAPAAAK